MDGEAVSEPLVGELVDDHGIVRAAAEEEGGIRWTGLVLQGKEHEGVVDDAARGLERVSAEPVRLGVQDLGLAGERRLGERTQTRDGGQAGGRRPGVRVVGAARRTGERGRPTVEDVAVGLEAG